MNLRIGYLMTDCSNSAVDYSELALMQLWLSEQGWVADRAQLSETTQNELKCLFKNQLSDQQFNHLIGSLNLAFSNAVELSERHLELRNLVNLAVQQQGRKSDLRENLERFFETMCASC